MTIYAPDPNAPLQTTDRVYATERRHQGMATGRAAFVDNRPAAETQRQLAETASNSLRPRQLMAQAQAMNTSRSRHRQSGRDGEPIQLIRDQEKDETLLAYSAILTNEATRLLDIDARTASEGGEVARANTLYLHQSNKAITTAKAANVYLKGAVDELKRAINESDYSGAMEAGTYALAGLAGDQERLKDQDIVKIKERVDAMNAGGTGRFNLHIGVGGLPTMDVTGTSFGGQGRGDIRLQFLGSGQMKLVNHAGVSYI